ncbi:MAG: hypothetical protein LBE89_01285 [Helicobacteraceae bacterium]|nr:hypothetical protein [Helicobacteraceae bacterium]
MKRGIALLITLLFLIAMFGFAALFFARSGRALARENAQQAAVSANQLLFQVSNEVLKPLTTALYKNAESICAIDEDKAKCKENFLVEAFNIFYQLPISLEAGGAVTILHCQAAQRAFDINLLKLPPGALTSGGHANDPVFRRIELFERYLTQKHGIYAAWQFIELLGFVFDTTGEQYPHLGNDKRLNVSNPHFERGRIGSLRNLMLIVDDYATLTRDERARKVPWERIFAFESLRGRIDFRHLNKESCEMIFFDDVSVCDLIGKERDIADYRVTEQLINTRLQYIIGDFAIDFGHNPVLECTIRYQRGADISLFSFAYDTSRNALFKFRIK